MKNSREVIVSEGQSRHKMQNSPTQREKLSRKKVVVCRCKAMKSCETVTVILFFVFAVCAKEVVSRSAEQLSRCYFFFCPNARNSPMRKTIEPASRHKSPNTVVKRKKTFPPKATVSGALSALNKNSSVEKRM